MRKLVLTFATALILVPALSFAAKPAKYSTFRWCESRQICAFGFETTRSGRYIKDIRAYNKCNEVPARFPRLRVKDGKFSKTGKLKNVIGQKLTYTIEGEFRKRKKAVGTYDIDRRDCRAKPRKFTARKVRPSPNEG